MTRLAWLGRERDNLRGALAWATATEEAEIAAPQWWAPEEGERVSYEPTRGWKGDSVPDFVDLVPDFSVMTLGRGPEGDTKAVLMLGDLPRPYLAHDPQSCSSQRADCAEGCPEAGAVYRRPKRPVSVMPGWPSSG